MPRIPLVGGVSKRSSSVADDFTSGKDQAFTNCHFQLFKNPVSGRETIRVKARLLFANTNSPSGAGAGTAIKIWTGNSNAVVTAYGNTNSTIYSGGTSLGTITGQGIFIDETIISSIAVITIVSNGNKAYYYAANAGAGNVSFTGDLNSNTTINNIASTTGMWPGQTVTHANIPAGAYIVSVDSATQITISAAATATAAAQSITRTAIAEIKDPDFPANAGKTLTGRFVHMDGFAFIAATDGSIWQSDINSLSSWTSTANISAAIKPDSLVGLAQCKRDIAAFGSGSIEFFYNAGNAAGAVLSRVTGASIEGGADTQSTIVQTADSVAFAGAVGGQYGVFLLEGYSARKISTPSIDELVAARRSNILLNAFSWYGRAQIVLTVISGGIRGYYSYDLTTGIWQILDFSDETELQRSDTVVSNAGLTCYYVGPDSGSVWANSGTSCAAMTIKTAKLDFGTSNAKTCSRTRLIGESSSDVSVSVTWYDDDYETPSATRTLVIGNGSRIAQMHRCGRFRRRAYLIEVASPVESFSLESLDIDVAEGAL